ncbi:MAG: RNA polymerase sigma factor [bacterium]
MKKSEFIQFYDQNASRIFRFVCLKVNSVRDSEDLTSEAFFKFWQNLKNNKKNRIDNPRALLYKIANNLVIDFYRKRPRTALILNPDDSILTKIPDNKGDLNKELNIDADMNKVKIALNKVKNEYQDIIIWHYLDDFSVKEIAQILEKQEGTVRVMVHRALKALKKEIQ